MRNFGLFTIIILSLFLPCKLKGQTLPYSVPEEKRVRVIISSDAANEVDDAYAIIHALLTPQFDVKGIIAAHFHDRVPLSMEKSYEEIVKIVKLAGFDQKVVVAKGAPHPLSTDSIIGLSTGTQLIIDEALKDDTHPLYVICGGPLTDVARSLMEKPEIADKMTVIWSGGGPYGGNADEYNLSNDPLAANVVFASDVKFWQIPSDAYSMVRTTTAELAVKVRPYGKIGSYLFQSILDFNEKKKKSKGWPRGEDWTLGDSPAISLIMNPNRHTDKYREIIAPHISNKLTYESGQNNLRKIRVYEFIDGRTLLEDFFAKIQLAYPL